MDQKEREGEVVMAGGDVCFWTVNGAIHMKVVDRIHGDPVELSVEEARELARRLLDLVEFADQ